MKTILTVSLTVLFYATLCFGIGGPGIIPAVHADPVSCGDTIVAGSGQMGKFSWLEMNGDNPIPASWHVITMNLMEREDSAPSFTQVSSVTVPGNADGAIFHAMPAIAGIYHYKFQAVNVSGPGEMSVGDCVIEVIGPPGPVEIKWWERIIAFIRHIFRIA